MLHHTGATPAEARAYLKQAKVMRAAVDDDAPVEDADDAADESGDDVTLSPERYAELGAHEQFVLAVSVNGFGKRTSSYEYRTSGRGGKGIIAMTVTPRNGKLVAVFPVDEADQIMLVTDAGQLIRCPVNDVRVAGRATQGVTIFRTADEESVVSVSHIADASNDDEDETAGNDHDGSSDNDDTPTLDEPGSEG